MIHSLLTRLDRHFSFDTASAHCDIPCKIYDPVVAQISALTVIRMMDMIAEIGEKKELTLADHAQLSRLVAEKESHAIRVKEEIRIIWGDYFKQPQFEKVPDAHELVHSIMLKASACKQHIGRDTGLELLNLVNQFAEAFWLTKEIATYTATSPYPPNEQVVYPKLGG